MQSFIYFIVFQDNTGNMIFSNQESENKRVDADGTLIVKKFSQEDVGFYRCVGNNGRGSLSAKVNIKIKSKFNYDFVKKANIFQEKNHFLELPNFPPIIDKCPKNINLTVSEFDFVEATCSLVRWQKMGRDSTFAFDWLQDGQLLTPSNDAHIVVSNNRSISRLRIYKFRKDEHSAKYTCRMSNAFGQSNCSSLIQFSTQGSKKAV